MNRRSIGSIYPWALKAAVFGLGVVLLMHLARYAYTTEQPWAPLVISGAYIWGVLSAVAAFFLFRRPLIDSNPSKGGSSS